MKLKNLETHNFTNLSSGKIDLALINAFVGNNEEGKTSLGDAIQFAYTGTCRTVKRNGMGATDLVTLGENEMYVRVIADFPKQSNVEVFRHLHPKGVDIEVKFDGKDMIMGKTEKQLLINKLFGGDKAMVETLFDAFSFLELDSDEQKKVLFQASGIDLSPTKLKNALVKSIGTEAADFGITILQDKINKPFDYIERQLTQYKSALKSKIPAIVPVEEVIDKGKEGMYKARLGAISTILSRFTEYESTQIRLKDLTGQKSEIKQPELKLMPLPEGVTEKDVVDEEMRNELKELLAKKETKEIIEANIKNYESEIEILKGKKSICPVLKEDCDRLEGNAKARITELKKAITEQTKKLPKVDGTKIEELTNTLGKIESYVRIKKDNDNLKASFDGMVKDIKTREKKLDDEIKELKAIVRPDGNLEELKAEKLDLEGKIAHYKAIDDIMAKNKDAQALKVKIEKELGDLDKLILAFSSDGIRQELAEKGMSSFLGAVNEVVTKLLGEGRKIEIDTEWRLWLVEGDKRIEVKNLSRSTKMRVGVGIQVGIGKMTGNEFVMLDDMEGLDSVQRLNVINFLIERKIGAVLRAVKGDSQVKPSPIPELKIFEVEDGAFREVTE